VALPVVGRLRHVVVGRHVDDVEVGFDGSEHHYPAVDPPVA
jgi:hypothetical protein